MAQHKIKLGISLADLVKNTEANFTEVYDMLGKVQEAVSDSGDKAYSYPTIADMISKFANGQDRTGSQLPTSLNLGDEILIDDDIAPDFWISGKASDYSEDSYIVPTSATVFEKGVNYRVGSYILRVSSSKDIQIQDYQKLSEKETFDVNVLEVSIGSTFIDPEKLDYNNASDTNYMTTKYSMFVNSLNEKKENKLHEYDTLKEILDPDLLDVTKQINETMNDFSVRLAKSDNKYLTVLTMANWLRNVVSEIKSSSVSTVELVYYKDYSMPTDNDTVATTPCIGYPSYKFSEPVTVLRVYIREYNSVYKIGVDDDITHKVQYVHRQDDDKDVYGFYILVDKDYIKDCENSGRDTTIYVDFAGGGKLSLEYVDNYNT